jgi:hypothetical protein
LTKIYGDEANSFAKFSAYAKRFKAADPTNYCKIQVYKEMGHFLGVFFAPSGLQHASTCIREIIGVDSTHTASVTDSVNSGPVMRQ